MKFEWKVNGKAILENLEIICSWNHSDSMPLYTKDILFIQGENSPYLSSEDHNLIQKFFPKATFTEIPDSGHRIHVEQPLVLANILHQFFTQK